MKSINTYFCFFNQIKKKSKKEERNDTFIIFSQQILNSKLLLTIIVGQKNNLNDGFRLEPMTTLHLRFVVKIF